MAGDKTAIIAGVNAALTEHVVADSGSHLDLFLTRAAAKGRPRKARKPRAGK